MRLFFTVFILSLAEILRASGTLVIIGGAFTFDNGEVWDEIEQNRLPNKPICVFGTASSTPQSVGVSVAQDFNVLYGDGTAFYVNITESNGAADDPDVAAQIAECGGCYFTGGDQRRIPRGFVRQDGSDTFALAEIRKILAAGGVVSGSSAGAAIMSDPMISGGNSDNALDFGAFPESSPNTGVWYDKGLGFLEGMAITDQHHLARGRLARLFVAAEATGFDLGVGVDENTALSVDLETGWSRVLGAMGVIVTDVSRMQRDEERRITGVRVHYLDIGDEYNLRTGEFRIGGEKQPIGEGALTEAELFSRDLWDDYEVWRLMTELVNTQGRNLALGWAENFDVWFRQGAQTQAWIGELHSYDNNRRAFTIIDMELSVVLIDEPFLEPAPEYEGLLIY